jgi:hypothetical protein
MTLFQDESVVIKSDDNAVTLTTHRICFEQKGFQTSGTKNIMLEHVTSCESITKKYYFWLIITVLGILALIGADNDIKAVGGIAGIIGVAAFFLTRKAFVKIASPTSEILINVKGMDRSKVLEFIDRIEQTKHKRLSTIGTRTNLT